VVRGEHAGLLQPDGCQHHTQVLLDVSPITAAYKTMCHGYMFTAISKHLLYLPLQA
jgi:hypothetical protein